MYKIYLPNHCNGYDSKLFTRMMDKYLCDIKGIKVNLEIDFS